MKQYTASLKSAVLLLSISLLFAVAPSAAKADSILIVSDQWCPYTCVPKSSHPGYLIQIARAVFKEHGIKVEYRNLPWSRAIGDTRGGRANAIAGALKDDAPDFIFPTQEIGFNKFGFFTYGTPWKYDGERSLQGQIFGTAKGYSYGKVIDKFITDGIIKTDVSHGVTPLRQNIYKARAGRISILIAETFVFTHTAQALGLNQGFRYAGSPDPGTPMYIAFSPALRPSARHANILSDGIRKLRSSGQLDKILAQYGLKDWK